MFAQGLLVQTAQHHPRVPRACQGSAGLPISLGHLWGSVSAMVMLTVHCAPHASWGFRVPAGAHRMRTASNSLRHMHLA